MEKLITWLVEELYHKNKKDLQYLVVFHAMTLYQITSQGKWCFLQKKKTLDSLMETRGEGGEMVFSPKEENPRLSDGKPEERGERWVSIPGRGMPWTSTPLLFIVREHLLIVNI